MDVSGFSTAHTCNSLGHCACSGMTTAGQILFIWPAAPLCVSGHGGSVLTRCRLLGPCLLLGASLRLRSPLLAQLAPHAGAAEHREQVVEGAVWPGCLVRCSCRGALRVGADSVSKPGMSSTIALSPEVELSRQGEQWPGDCPVRFSYLLCSSHCVVCV